MLVQMARVVAFQPATREWKKLGSNNKTIPNFHKHFIEVYEELLKDEDSNKVKTSNQAHNAIPMDLLQSILEQAANINSPPPLQAPKPITKNENFAAMVQSNKDTNNMLQQILQQMASTSTNANLANTIPRQQRDHRPKRAQGGGPSKTSYPCDINAILDSGSSGHYFPFNSSKEATTTNHQTIKITQPDGNTLCSTNKGIMPILPQLPLQAREAFAFRHIKYPLLSVAKLCDSDCSVFFEKDKVTIKHNNIIIAQAQRDFVSNLWTLPLKTFHKKCNHTTKHYSMQVIRKETNNIQNLTEFFMEQLGTHL